LQTGRKSKPDRGYLSIITNNSKKNARTLKFGTGKSQKLKDLWSFIE